MVTHERRDLAAEAPVRLPHQALHRVELHELEALTQRVAGALERLEVEPHPDRHPDELLPSMSNDPRARFAWSLPDDAPRVLPTMRHRRIRLGAKDARVMGLKHAT